MKFSKTAGLKRAGRAFAKQIGPAEAAFWAGEIGAGWTNRLKGSKSYSGMKLGPLSKCLTPIMAKYHESLYSLQSAPVHATAISSLIKSDESAQGIELEWQSTSTVLQRGLRAACSMFYSQIEALHESLDLGIALGSQLAAFA